MAYWIFTVTGHKSGGEVLSARKILDARIEDSFWGLGERTPNRRNLEQGDRVVFYVGLPDKIFAATAILASPSFELTEEQRKNYGHGVEFFTTNYGVLLSEINLWGKPRAVEDLVPLLEFIENKQFWYSYFQGGARGISEEDFRLITGERETSLVRQIATSKDIENQAEFALESQLEEFLYTNWENINWGSRLQLYRTDEQNGRQFPAGKWNIDFLSLDLDTNDLVVIELKRGKTSDSAVGQLLRYITWVRENVAQENQNVKGIIIAKQVDDTLEYAIRDLSYIEVKTYTVDFALQSH